MLKLRVMGRAFVGAMSVGLVLALAGANASAQTVYYVKTTGSDGNSGFTEMAAFKTIGKAVDAASGETSSVIRVLAGTYDQSHESTNPFGGFPITIDFSNVSIQANGGTRPVVGGGVSDSTVLGLFEVIADTGTGGDATGVAFTSLEFAGEDSTSENAPSAVYAFTSDNYDAEIAITDCHILRSEMNHSTLAGNPSIRGISGEGPGLTLTVSDCVIAPNEPGGVVVDLGTDAVASGDGGSPTLIVEDSVFSVAQGNASHAAIDMILEAYDPSTNTGLLGDPFLTVTDCVIDSRAATTFGTGFSYGIAYGGDARFGGAVQFGHFEVKIQRNEIHGCRQAGLHLLGTTDGLMDSSVNIQSWYVDNNLISENVGDGVLLDGGDSANDGQYLRWYLRGNMIVDNDGDGIEVRDITAGNSGQGHVLNCTLAGNGGYGIRMTNSLQDEWLSHVQNSIIWDNASGNSTGWSPSSSLVTVQYNIWDGTPPVGCVDSGCSPSPTCKQNVNVDPLFVDPSNGDYHISSSSCAVEGGTNTPSTTNLMGFGTDIDGERRNMDGDSTRPSIVDMGADEYEP
ncbi:MAG: hypothetical protein DHS20C15_31510 [Planctomycetota bacterium]|nr:MAG: hypothetical protein DHS20C15_31510 [Planctomycetota bacterium]